MRPFKFPTTHEQMLGDTRAEPAAGLPATAAKPAAVNTNAPAPRPRHSNATTAQHAMDEGETLVEAAVEESQPTYDVAKSTPDEAGQAHGEGHAQRPAWQPSNPWPTAHNAAPLSPTPADHKPFKGLK